MIEPSSGGRSEARTYEYEFSSTVKRRLWEFWRTNGVAYGTITAKSEQAAIEALNLRPNLTVTDVRPMSGTAALVRRRLFHSKVKPETVLEFIANFSTMTDGDIPPSQACEILAGMETNPYMAQVLLTMAAMMSSAKLWEAASFFPDVFPPYVVAVIHSGEDKTILHEVLHDLENEMRHKRDLSLVLSSIWKDVGSTSFSIAVLVVIFMVYFVPTLLNPVGQSGTPAVAIPGIQFLTAPLLLIATLLRSVIFDVAALVFGIALFVAFRAYIATPRGFYWWSGVLLRRTGQVGRLIGIQAQAEVLRAFARLYELGEVPYDAWTYAVATTENPIYRDAFTDVRDRTNRGVQLTQALTDTGVIDQRAITMIHAAEPGGNDVLAQRMMTLSADFRSEARRRLGDVARSFHNRSQYVMGGIILAVTLLSFAIFANSLGSAGTTPP